MASPASASPSPHRALLVLSFGGPEKNEDVIPFLENVTRGRGIPRERLAEVGEHYFAMDGKSPITEQNRRIIADVEALIAERVAPSGTDLPVYFGNRNWYPFVEDTVAQMARDGITEALVLATSAWGGYSGHVQYLEDIARAEASCRDAGLTPPAMTKIRPFHDHPLFTAAFARLVDEARAAMPGGGEDARLIFTAHSVPVSADEASSAENMHRYSGQVLTAAREIRQLSSFAVDGAEGADVELVWQSRSGPPHIPWLEPDICDYLEATVAGEGMADFAGSLTGSTTPGDDTRPVLLCPVGFITDHMEVIWDLDTEAAQAADELGISLTRVPTPGFEPEFTRMVLDLVHEHWPDIPGEDAS